LSIFPEAAKISGGGQAEKEIEFLGIRSSKYLGPVGEAFAELFGGASFFPLEDAVKVGDIVKSAVK
jgi:hypothetical protein